MSEVIEMNLLDIQPSQLYISKVKLESINEWLNVENDYKYEPIPVKYLNGKIIFTDGHTRAFALYKRGIEKVRVFWDTDELDWEVYQVCVGWCVDEGITDISHLQERVIDSKQYEQLWLGRCSEMIAELERKRLQNVREV